MDAQFKGMAHPSPVKSTFALFLPKFRVKGFKEIFGSPSSLIDNPFLIEYKLRKNFQVMGVLGYNL